MIDQKLLAVVHLTSAMGHPKVLRCFDRQGAVALIYRSAGGEIDEALSNVQMKTEPPSFWGRDPLETLEQIILVVERGVVTVGQIEYHPDIAPIGRCVGCQGRVAESVGVFVEAGPDMGLWHRWCAPEYGEKRR